MTKYIYICAAGHSGSTLLDLLLGSHSRIASLGEIDHLSKNLALNSPCSCGEPVRECKFWKTVLTNLSVRLKTDVYGNPYDLVLGYPRASRLIDPKHQTTSYLLKRRFLLGLYYAMLRFRPLTPNFLGYPIDKSARTTLELFEVVRSSFDLDAVVDSSKSYLRAISLYRANPENVRILLLSRDGRGVLWSNLKRSVPAKQAIAEWRNQYRRALPLFEKHIPQSAVLQVKYEDLTQDPTRELDRICRFIGQKFEKEMLNYSVADHHITNGNDIRMSPQREIRPDTEWKDRLSEAQRVYFHERAADVNRLLGYSDQELV